MSSGNVKIKNLNYKMNSHKLRCSYNPKMMQQFMLIVVFVVCLSSKAQRAFVSADDGNEMEATTFGEYIMKA